MFKLISGPHLALYECDKCCYQIYGHPKDSCNKLETCPCCGEPTTNPKGEGKGETIN